jgi:hypothetical protein
VNRKMLRCTAALSFAAAFAFCSSHTARAGTITVKNDLDLARPAETVEVPWSDLEKGLPNNTKADRVVVSDSSGKDVVAQPIYLHGQKKPAEMLIFQADFAPNESKTFTIKPGEPKPYEPKVYGRWVPERNDDFAWENDKVAFRIYGPLLEIVEPASSGVDTWQKRSPNLVINKWYQMAQSINSNYYHYDHGEGLDGYKVGHSQGDGGTAVWLDGKRFTTGIKGWKKQNVIANGPIRLIFDLTYDPIDVDGNNVHEVKRITLDAGRHLNHFESTFTMDKPDEKLQVLAGLGEHQDRPFEKQINKDKGFITMWDAADNPGEKKPTPDAPSGHTGVAVVMLPGDVIDAFEADHHLELSTKMTTDHAVSFWAGSGWDKSGDFSSYDDWNKYVDQCAKRLASPLKVSVSQ